MGDELMVENQIAGIKRRKRKFFRRRGSLWARVATPGGPVEAVWVASEFRVVGLGLINANEGWCTVIAFDDPDGFERKCYVTFAQLVRDPREAIANLVHCGLMVRPGRLGRDLFCGYLMSAARHVDTRIKILTGLPFGSVFTVIVDGASRTSGDEKREA
jgi:hypothetical protein